MERAQPLGLDRRRVRQLLSKARRDRSVGGRIEILSRQFLGRRYQPNPLIGSADTAEVFTASFDGCDCVTYIEIVLALALASNVNGFVERLRKIRYEHGRIQWRRRNHYSTGWIRNNARIGMIKPLSLPTVPTVARDRVLNLVPGLAAHRTRVRCVPKSATPRLQRFLRSGDLVFFASTRMNLDVFHAGIIVRDAKSILMRHASRSRGRVVEQPLSEFLKANRMAGIIVVRPLEKMARRSRA